MNIRQLLFQKIISERNNYIIEQENVPKKITKNNQKIEKDVSDEQNYEDLSQKEIYHIMIDMANRKLNEGETSKKRRKKIIAAWINYSEDFFPILEEPKNLFD